LYADLKSQFKFENGAKIKNLEIHEIDGKNENKRQSVAQNKIYLAKSVSTQMQNSNEAFYQTYHRI